MTRPGGVQSLRNAGARSDLILTLTVFVRALRERGLLVTPAETITATRALALVDIGDRGEVYLALRSILASRREDYPVFDEIFNATWDFLVGGRTTSPPAGPQLNRIAPPSPAAPHPSTPSIDRWTKPGEADGDALSVARESDRESAGVRDFRALQGDELDEITRVARRIARRLARRPSRRWRSTLLRGSKLDMRRTVRRSLATGGEAAGLIFRERKPRKTKLVAMCDVSGSMDIYGRFLLQFLYALQNSFASVETFVFSTRLSRISDELQQGSYRQALARLGAEPRGWSGGTRIGASLAEFNDGWLRTVDRRTVVIVLSDGWDTGEPEVLGDAMRRIRSRAGKVIWLNPLLANPSYRPLTRGIQAALPHVDVFASLHNLESLQRLGRLLSL